MFHGFVFIPKNVSRIYLLYLGEMFHVKHLHLVIAKIWREMFHVKQNMPKLSSSGIFLEIYISTKLFFIAHMLKMKALRFKVNQFYVLMNLME